jgi:Concanavalin A-like lectin/glucanases superfamily
MLSIAATANLENVEGAVSRTRTAPANIKTSSTSQFRLNTKMITKHATSRLAFVLLCMGLRTEAATALHHFQFEGSEVVDSIGSATGSLVGGATLEFGRLNLDGQAAYVQFADYLIPALSDFSVTFFARETATASVAGFAELISQSQSGNPAFYFGYDPARNIRVGDSWQDTGVPFPSDGNWHHYAIVSGATEARLYIDGSVVATGNPFVVGSGGPTTRLGRQVDPNLEFFAGSLDEIWIFQGVLNNGEVASLAVAVPEPNEYVAFGGLTLVAFALYRRGVR